MLERAMDAHDHNRKGLQQQQAVIQPNSFTIPSYDGDYFPLAAPHVSQLGALPAPDAFLPAPVFLSSDPRCPTQAIGGCCNSTSPVLPNQQLSLDTELFTGSLLVNIKGYPGTPSGVFRNSKWLGQTIIQGRFTQQVAASDLWVGQELWNKPMLPHSFQKLIFSTSAKLFSSTSRIKTEGEGVGFLNPLLAMAQVVNVSRPGSEPDMHQEVADDVRLMCSSLADKKGQPLASHLRQKYFDKPSNLAAVQFDTEHVYTFVIGQSIMDMMRYRLALGGLLNMDLCPILNGQPLQMMCKNIRNDKTVLSLLVWHERLNYKAGCKAPAGSSSSSGGGCSSSGGGCSSSSGLSSAECCIVNSSGSCILSSSNYTFDGCHDSDAIGFFSACSQMFWSGSAQDIADVADKRVGDLGEVACITRSSTAGAATLQQPAAAGNVAAGTAAAAQVHSERPQEAAAAVAPCCSHKRSPASKRFKKWVKKVLNKIK